jgi:hypothetical protein
MFAMDTFDLEDGGDYSISRFEIKENQPLVHLKTRNFCVRIAAFNPENLTVW